MTRAHIERGDKPLARRVTGSWALLVATCLLAIGGCPPTPDPTPLEVGLNGFIGLELGTGVEDGTPVAEPVAVWLAPGSGGPFPADTTVVPLAGATVEVRVAGVLIGSTATNAAGMWELPRRTETRVRVTVTGPAGLFDTLAPAAIVRDLETSIAATEREPWPRTSLRVSRDEVLGGVSVIIEEARSG